MKVLLICALLLIPVFSIAFFGGPYASVNHAGMTMVMNESIRDERGVTIAEVQKFYDYEERVLCYVYVGVAISCVNDQTN